VPGQHVANAADPAVCTTDHGQPLECERRPSAVSKKMFERLTFDTPMGTKERDADPGVD
jgi:hypothetical protein